MLDHDTEKGDIIQTVPGISDAGAHLAIMQDGTAPTTILAHVSPAKRESAAAMALHAVV